MPVMSPKSTATPPHKGDINALAHAMVPVAKLCMRSGMGAGELLIAVKMACITVAGESAQLGNRLNHSRISAATGLTRKEVRVLSAAAKSGKVATERSASKQRTTRVLQGWRTDPEYLDARGSPLSLPINGEGLCFHSLVRRYGGDVTPVSVLNELVRSGAVSRIRDDKVAVKKSSSRVKGFTPDVIAEVAARIRDVGATLVHNVENTIDPLFVGFEDVNDLSPDEAALFQLTFSERAASLVDGISRWRASQVRVRDKKQGAANSGIRVGLGVFLVGEPQSVAPLASKSKATGKATAKV